MTRHIKTDSRARAWQIADEIIPCDYLPTDTGAGYPVYVGTQGGHWISDQGIVLEVNLANGDTDKVWIVEIWE